MKMSVALVAGLLLVPAAGAYAQGVDDAQIASIVVTANQVDIDAGKLASSMASNPEVKKFGEQMVTDHTGVNKQAVDLVTKLKVTPKDNPTSTSLKEGGAANVANLKTAEGCGVRQGLHRSRGRVSPAGARRGRQDADPERVERGAEGAAREGAAGVRRPPRTRQDGPVVAVEVGVSTLMRGVAAPRRRRPGAAVVQRPRRGGQSGPDAGHSHRDDRSGRLHAGVITSRPAIRSCGSTRIPFPHTVTAKAGGFDSLSIQPDRSWTLTPSARGEITYTARCTRR